MCRAETIDAIGTFVEQVPNELHSQGEPGSPRVERTARACGKNASLDARRGGELDLPSSPESRGMEAVRGKRKAWCWGHGLLKAGREMYRNKKRKHNEEVV